MCPFRCRSDSSREHTQAWSFTVYEYGHHSRENAMTTYEGTSTLGRLAIVTLEHVSTLGDANALVNFTSTTIEKAIAIQIIGLAVPGVWRRWFSRA